MRYRFLAFFLLLAIPAFADEAHLPTAPLSIVTQQGPVHFTVEVATTPAQQEHGLMFRKSVPDNEGMIFLFPVAKPVMMWMKNTLVSLDMVFIDDKGIVINIAERAVPESETIIRSGGDAKAVLELAGGAAARFHIAKGDKVLYSAFP